MNEEKWININEFPNYLISNYGRVKNINTNQLKTLRLDKDGYLTVSLWKNNKETNCKVHRLVGIYFLEGYFDEAVINHKDENKQNNYYENLEWCTIKYNNLYNNKPHKCDKQVNMYDLNGKYIKTFNSLQEVCDTFNKTKGNLSSHLKGKQKTFAGHIFKYN